MGFVDSYKNIEKLCSEMYSDNHGLSTYIDEMAGKPNGSYYVPGWDEDLKQLKHYRWVRNQIVHEPGCTEENMCVPEDVRWLNNFYARIMSVSDPLALYRKARSPQTTSKPKQTYVPQPTGYTYTQPKKVSSKSAGCLTYLIGALLGVAVIAFIIISI